MSGAKHHNFFAEFHQTGRGSIVACIVREESKCSRSARKSEKAVTHTSTDFRVECKKQPQLLACVRSFCVCGVAEALSMVCRVEQIF